jgi:hypothetical protein
VRFVAWFAFAALGCGAGQSPPSGETAVPTLATSAVAPLPSTAAAPAGARPAAPAGASDPAAPASPAASAGNAPGAPIPKRFPPPEVTPPHARSAEKYDGRWALYLPPSRSRPVDVVTEPVPFARTVIHPHEASRFITVTIVAIDLQEVTLNFMPGSEDLGGQKVPFAAGLVPSPERERLLAVYNGGFQPRHGHWGMKLGDTTVVPPRDDGCTLALYADGSVRLRSWPVLAGSAASMRAFRQTPPCLVEEGAVHPELLAGRDKAWAGQAKDLVTRRRSAVGLDASGTVLFYAIGVEATPRLLGEALRTAGAANAAELDINWNWTRFLLYELDGHGKPRVADALVPGEFSKSGYVDRPSERDFFYVLRR